MIEIYNKSQDFFLPEHQQQNEELWREIYGMELAKKLSYFRPNGLNLVDLSRARVKNRSERVVWLEYESHAVLSSQERS